MATPGMPTMVPREELTMVKTRKVRVTPPEQRQRRHKTEVGEIVRVGKSQTTGATTTVEKAGPGHPVEETPGWIAYCLNHDQYVYEESVAPARAEGAHPEQWCTECAKIASGKSEKIKERMTVEA